MNCPVCGIELKDNSNCPQCGCPKRIIALIAKQEKIRELVNQISVDDAALDAINSLDNELTISLNNTVDSLRKEYWKTNSKSLEFKGYEFEIGKGEYRRYIEENGSTSGEYLCYGSYNNNHILFQYIELNAEPINYVKSVLENIPDFAFNYLMTELIERQELVVRMSYFPGSQTSFEIYYNYDQSSNDISWLIQWMGEHNDFAAQEYRYTQIIDGHQSCIGSDEDTVSYSKGEILYIYKGNIRCHRYAHQMIQVTAVLHSKTDDEIQLNVEYCTECKKFILDYTVFEQYRNRYGALVGNFRMVINGEFDGEYDLAEESPLMLSGYNVRQKDGYTSQERHYILARIIHDGIMDKGDVIRYLSYFIHKNGAKRGNELALSKWKEDLAFVQNYNMSTQPRTIISGVRRY